ncbi:hypothetical protein SISSUDRAFT_1063441 [Sistotremastrum suecicum HHB10207 ss-3]|uniref:DUF676 domain-containing protein n=1 Tax=Sistotremastrum suecicum HHB10207 ss-3 TaxID=1314776 RepID=A0A166BS12_9AGAM|nr:hypothetical protein SISSUDRAFT_1063441 [Sistotremastrum suecicum HHB10207 ss-3]
MSSSASSIPSPDNSQAVASLRPLPPDLLLLVFIHGFKGTDSTFSTFPQRLQHNLQETIPDVVVRSIVFPAYETRGELKAAVEKFADWLATLTVENEVAHGSGGGAGKAKIVLCGHSMGGLVAADTFIGIATSRADKEAPLWPKIIALIAFDTPYFGLHPYIFKHKVTEGLGYVQAARDIAAGFTAFSALKASASSQDKKDNEPKPVPKAAIPAPPQERSVWQKWAPVAYGVGGALIAGAAAGTAYYKREDVGQGFSWASDHMKYVGTLWDETALKTRMDQVVDLGKEFNVVFRTFYTILPAKPPSQPLPRTFIILPPSTSKSVSCFLPARNTNAADEVQAHVGMFEPTTNDGYYELGLETAKLIREAISMSRGTATVASSDTPATKLQEPGQHDPLDPNEPAPHGTPSARGEMSEKSNVVTGDLLGI